MPKMKDSELLVIVNSLENDSTAYNGEFMKVNEELLKRYNRELYGDEVEGQSSVVASDVSDQVDSDMTSLVRIFLGSGDVMVFEPNTDNEEEEEEAQQKTKYINHVVRHRAQSYKTIHDWMKDAEIQKMGVLYYYMDETLDTSEIEYKGLNTIQISQIMKDMEAKDGVEKVEIVSQEEIKNGVPGGAVFNIRFRLRKKFKTIEIDNIPTEDFLISKNASSEDDANMIGHVSWPTRSELVMGGMSEEKVAKFPANSDTANGSTNNSNSGSSYNGSTMKQIRWRDEGGNITDDYAEWAAEKIRVVTMYAKVDVDGDGIAERRYIEKIGNEITKNEPFDHVPYAILSCILDPHKAIGRSRASLVVEDQRVKTVLQRQINNNIYKVNNPRTAVGENVDMDDMLDIRLDGLVRVEGLPQNEIMPMVTPYIGDKALQVIQYLDSAKAQRAGTLMASQGLEADNLNKETATRFNGVEKAAEAKIELVARNFAETGFRKLYDGIAYLAAHYQDEQQEVRILGKPLSIKPTDWKYKHNTVSKVGLGAGSGQQAVQNMSGILAIQQQLAQSGSMLVDAKKTYNALDEMVMGLGLARTDQYFNNPDMPDQMLLAQVEKLTVALQQSQQMLDQLQQKNPLAEAEMIKQQGAIATAQAKNQTELLKASENSRLKELELAQNTGFHESDKTFDYAKLEIENGIDIPGQGQGQ